QGSRFRVHLYGSIRASFGASTSATVVVPLRARFRFVVLLLRMCCLNALLRKNFPPLVRLKRLAAPRCVFSFGMSVAPGLVQRRWADARVGVPAGSSGGRNGRTRPAAPGL